MGVVLALVGALGFSFMNVFVRNGVRPDDRDNGLFITMLINVAIFGLLTSVMVLAGGMPDLSAEGAAWFIASGLAATFLGRQALFAGIRHIGAARGAAIKNITPLVTVAIALTFLGERLTLVDGAGIALILVGLFALIAESLRSAPDPFDGERSTDPIEAAFESEALAEVGLWDRTRGLAERTVAMIRKPSRRRVVLGIAMGLLAALFFGSGHAFRKLGMDLMPNAILGSLIGSSTAIASYLLTVSVRGEAAVVIRSSLTTVRPWFWAAGLAGTVGQLCFFAALAFAPVSHVSVVAGSETVLTVIIAAVLAGRIEAITRRVVLPAVLVFAGAALIGAAQ
jgi:drug/metabolite transporter (DMT)-like permease